ncbi:hypothetical protein [Winogradskyella thalassocola]|uniref:Uncharacterized protein n=1 Tax=Winogradskyella thalassocola TaxID=262004 RepID=A0A1G8B973_9FLAO|nr:hypothetical protein [Winogradskyella thalassocola]SDH29651.1 hypothetical protein SAMN04489796_102184 [Winogradskyella thalassocola]
MKKLSLIIFTVFLNMALFSCNPESIVDEVIPQACCGDGGEIPPPDPPPTTPPTGNGG